uniref:Uncharacterized protein n=1 Tax=viral metagenome TaxID=1070528 RepID=A0A6C0E278_9ZZZZ
MNNRNPGRYRPRRPGFFSPSLRMQSPNQTTIQSPRTPSPRNRGRTMARRQHLVRNPYDYITPPPTIRHDPNVNLRRFYGIDENNSQDEDEDDRRCDNEDDRSRGFLYNYDSENEGSGSEGSENEGSGSEGSEGSGSDGSKKRSKKRNKKRSKKRSIKKSKKRSITSMFSRPKGKGLLILKMLKTKSPKKVYNILKKKSIKSGKKTWTKLSTIRTFKKLHM